MSPKAGFRWAAGALFAAIVAAPSAAPAEETTTISIQDDHRGVEAADFGDQLCDANQGGGPYVGEDVWVFNLPGGKRDFISLTVTFDTGAGETTLTLPEDGTIIANGEGPGSGTSKAWVRTEAGWTISAADAEVTETSSRGKTGDFFVLTHTCAADDDGEVPPEESDDGNGGEESPDDGSGDGSTDDGSENNGADDETSPAAESGDELPTTGAGLTWALVAGAGLLLAGGSALFFLRVRKDA
ncbi:LPXTG cell wall anchor domain-containing protein [Haloglycomyces albus]|uniref:LPXTG cell wall anchor domain-containing protein n=1 Tax=Haloglycomyces albus TaxID=526067 RepID=UPI00046D5A59|nr:LPXTG cell wall anchor domain-containing protein [Haloglycomyces albus]